MKYVYNLSARGTYFKFIITSMTDDGTETFIAMYDFPINQSYTRGIYVNDNGMVMQRGLVFLCAFPGKNLNIMEVTITTRPDGDPMIRPNDFYIDGELSSMYGLFQYLLENTGK